MPLMIHAMVIKRLVKKAVFTAALLLFCRPLFGGEDDVFSSPLNAENRPRFLAVCAELARHPVIRGNFEQVKTINSMNRSLTSTGNFIISAAQGMVWETLKPFPSTLAVGRDYMIQLMPATGRKTKMDAAGNETFMRLSDTLSAVFSGDSKKLLDNFEIYFSENRSENWTLGLIPKDRAVRVFADKFILSGSSGGGTISTIRLFQQNGDSIRYGLFNHQFAQALSAHEKALFSPD